MLFQFVLDKLNFSIFSWSFEFVKYWFFFFFLHSHVWNKPFIQKEVRSARLTAVVAVYSSLFLLDQARLSGLEDWTLYRCCDTITECVEWCVENIGAMSDLFHLHAWSIEKIQKKILPRVFPLNRLWHFLTDFNIITKKKKQLLEPDTFQPCTTSWVLPCPAAVLRCVSDAHAEDWPWKRGPANPGWSEAEGFSFAAAGQWTSRWTALAWSPPLHSCIGRRKKKKIQCLFFVTRTSRRRVLRMSAAGQEEGWPLTLCTVSCAEPRTPCWQPRGRCRCGTCRPRRPAPPWTTALPGRLRPPTTMTRETRTTRRETRRLRSSSSCSFSPRRPSAGPNTGWGTRGHPNGEGWHARTGVWAREQPQVSHDQQQGVAAGGSRFVTFKFLEGAKSRVSTERFCSTRPEPGSWYLVPGSQCLVRWGST